MTDGYQMQAAMEDSMWRHIGALEAENDELSRRLGTLEAVGVRHLIVDLGWLFLAIAFTVGLWAVIAALYAPRSASNIISACV